nr:pleckstrin homology domain-containing family A member 7 [Ciona intestinalis]|eukprot:XP_026694271.1 pleckstrin homology domain-containing family A member 7 [Ciona intestinalis]
MPKVLQRAKRDREFKHDDHVTDSDQSPRSPHIDVDQSDFDLTTELVVPNKVLIPDRLVEYEDVELTPEQEKIKQQKVDAIERMLARSGQTASNPTVHLAAALAAEAGTVARAVAFQAKHKNDDTATIQPFIV